jgi:hypothetical protein
MLLMQRLVTARGAFAFDMDATEVLFGAQRVVRAATKREIFETVRAALREGA